MLKAKTKKNLITILCAVLGVVFAFITGVTYCVNSINLLYGINPKTAGLYLANQQYHLVNDTIDQPILFGEGSHNFEIALMYAIDYDFDVRLKYSMTWSQGVQLANETVSTKATNVNLHFANRDNTIYDENYIFIANHVSAGSGKLNIITGLDFVDSTDKQYYGQTLRIDILDVKIVKKQTEYAKANHALTVPDNNNATPDADISTSLAAQAWIYYKNKSTSNNAYVMMYNNRRNYDTGIPYTGLNTAYKKSIDSTKKVSVSSWLGGEKSYAGVSMYVITGTEPIKLQMKIAGIWRGKDNKNITDENAISENSIKYNYTANFVHASWESNRLWETRNFNYVIPANSAYHIDILENIEIISAARIETNYYDAYRLVTNSIVINPGLKSADGNTNLESAFQYNEDFADFVQLQTLHTNSSLSVTNSYQDLVDDEIIQVVNSSLYSNGMYESIPGQTSKAQTFSTNINLINKTAQRKTVSVEYQLNYTISNGKENLTNSTTTDGEKTYTRADEYVTETHTKLDVFKENLYYSYNLTTDQLAEDSKLQTEVVIDPYSSVNICESYKVSANLRDEISGYFDPAGENDIQADGLTDYYDVWTYLTVTPKVVADKSQADLTIEKSVDDSGKVELSVKNNSQKTITGIEINSLVVEELELEENSYTLEGLEQAPNDWSVNYWKYYSRSEVEGKTIFSQLKTEPEYVANQYWKKSQDYETLSYIFENAFDYYKTFDDQGNVESTDTNKIVNTTKVLQPGESVVFATATTTATKQVKVSGFAKSSNVTNEQTAMLIDEGDDEAYIINTSSTNSYFIRFTGTYTGADSHFEKVTQKVDNKDVDYYYYLEILRPGQIINVPMSQLGNMTANDIVQVGVLYDETALTAKGWDSSIVTIFTNFFSMK